MSSIQRYNWILLAQIVSINLQSNYYYYVAVLIDMVCTIKNSITPLDRTHRVLLGRRIGALEQIPGRIGAGFTKAGS